MTLNWQPMRKLWTLSHNKPPAQFVHSLTLGLQPHAPSRVFTISTQVFNRASSRYLNTYLPWPRHLEDSSWQQQKTPDAFTVRVVLFEVNVFALSLITLGGALTTQPTRQGSWLRRSEVKAHLRLALMAVAVNRSAARCSLVKSRSRQWRG